MINYMIIIKKNFSSGIFLIIGGGKERTEKPRKNVEHWIENIFTVSF